MKTEPFPRCVVKGLFLCDPLSADFRKHKTHADPLGDAALSHGRDPKKIPAPKTRFTAPRMPQPGRWRADFVWTQARQIRAASGSVGGT